MQIVFDSSNSDLFLLVIRLFGIDPDVLSFIYWLPLFEPLHPDPAIMAQPNTSSVWLVLSRLFWVEGLLTIVVSRVTILTIGQHDILTDLEHRLLSLKLASIAQAENIFLRAKALKFVY